MVAAKRAKRGCVYKVNAKEEGYCKAVDRKSGKKGKRLCSRKGTTCHLKRPTCNFIDRDPFGPALRNAKKLGTCKRGKKSTEKDRKYCYQAQKGKKAGRCFRLY
jgi:hypothetical protein